MRPASRIAAAIDLLCEIKASVQRPADALANQFFRSRRYIGSKDRRAISTIIWEVMRHWRRLHWMLDAGEDASMRMIVARYFLEAGYALRKVSSLFAQGPYGPGALRRDETQCLKNSLASREERRSCMTENVRLEVPDWLYEMCQRQWPHTIVQQLQALLGEAPFDLRVNLLKTTRSRLAQALKERGLPVVATELSPWGLRLPHRYQVMNMDLYRQGDFEIQDEGSQIVAAACDVQPGMRVMDYCAGAGGKSLALAMVMNNKGYLAVCDISAKRLSGAKKRLGRAGVSNMQLMVMGGVEKRLKRKKKSFDCVLVDAPCSGTGTIRRNPDILMRLSRDHIDELRRKQAEILDEASAFVKEGGRLVYATCSLLDCENQEQVTAFLREHDDFELVDNKAPHLPSNVGRKAMLSLTPARDHTDGFFVATMKRVHS